jgi:hypothetical protein
MTKWGRPKEQLKEGNLELSPYTRDGTFRKTLEKRYCILTSQFMYYYKSKV